MTPEHQPSENPRRTSPATGWPTEMEDADPLRVRLPLVCEIMAADLATVEPDTPTMEAANLMAERDIGCVIVSRGLAIRGIFTERDLLQRAIGCKGWESMPVRRFMTSEPVTIGPDEPLPRVVELLEQAHVRHLPVVEEGRVVGVLSVRDVMRHRAECLEWLVEQQTHRLRVQTAELQHRNDLLQHHLDLAGRIQRHMLPADREHLPPFALAVVYRPFDHVSGDYYDYAPLSGNRLGGLIADASGHGIPAAFVSVVAKAVFHAEGEKGHSPAAVLHHMNGHLLGLFADDRFVTMFYGILDRRTLEFRYAGAGHPPPLWYRSTQDEVTTLDTQGLPLGIVGQPDFAERSVKLAPGDRLLLYTDGVTEIRNAEQEMFGRGRLAALLAEHHQASSTDLVAEVAAELDRFRGERPAGDDITCVAIAVEDQP